MTEEEYKNKLIKLHSTGDLAQRIEMAKLLYQKAEGKITHADMFRQRNMNYAMVIFAGMIALGVRLPNFTAQAIVSSTLLVFMVIFCLWDRRWHRIKHGWQHTATRAFSVMARLVNTPEGEESQAASGTQLILYDASGEEKAELLSPQPVVFYLLIIGAAASFFLFWYSALGSG